MYERKENSICQQFLAMVPIFSFYLDQNLIIIIIIIII